MPFWLCCLFAAVSVMTTNFDYDLFKSMPEIVSKNLHTAIWRGCALQLEYEQTTCSWTGTLSESVDMLRCSKMFLWIHENFICTKCKIVVTASIEGQWVFKVCVFPTAGRSGLPAWLVHSFLFLNPASLSSVDLLNSHSCIGIQFVLLPMSTKLVLPLLQLFWLWAFGCSTAWA